VTPATSGEVAAADLTLVWIDAESAVIVTWRNHAATFERFVSDVPAHQRAMPHIRHDPLIRHGGGESQNAAAMRRRERLTRFRGRVREGLPEAGAVMVVGPGSIHEDLAREVVEDDRRHRRGRSVESASSPPLTDRQLVAMVRRLVGDEPRRRRIGSGI
jgi:hypothetical protein